MADKKVTGFVKLQIHAGAANPAPPVGPALGAQGVNIMQFCRMSVTDELDFINGLQLTGKDAMIADQILKEIRARLGFLQSVGLRYLTLSRGVAAETAASFASLFYFGITAGRAACGFITMKFNDTQMIRMGQIILAVGVAALLIPGPQALALAGLVLVGLGCAPIYPSIIHSTPDHFGADKSQAVIGIQMASAYVGNLTMPPLFGLLANNITPALFPFYLLALLVLMVCMHEQLVRKTRRS